MTPPSNTLTVVLGRCSKGSDTQQNSFERQTLINDAYMERVELQTCPALVLEDDGVSGWQTDTACLWERPSGKRAIELLSNGIRASDLPPELVPPGAGEHVPLDHLLVATVDRAGRRLEFMLTVRRWFMEHRKHLHVGEVGRSLSRLEPSEQLQDFTYLCMAGMAAEYESSRMSCNVRRTFDVKRGRGELCSGTAPFGQRAVPSGEFRRKKVNGTWIEREILLAADEPAELAILDRMIDDHYRRGCGAFQMARVLNDLGYAAKEGGAWREGNVRSVLHNRFTTLRARSAGLTRVPHCPACQSNTHWNEPEPKPTSTP